MKEAPKSLKSAVLRIDCSWNGFTALCSVGTGREAGGLAGQLTTVVIMTDCGVGMSITDGEITPWANTSGQVILSWIHKNKLIGSHTTDSFFDLHTQGSLPGEETWLEPLDQRGLHDHAVPGCASVQSQSSFKNRTDGRRYPMRIPQCELSSQTSEKLGWLVLLVPPLLTEAAVPLLSVPPSLA